VSALAEDSTGRIWAAAINGVLMCAGRDEFQDMTRLLPSGGESILCLYATPDGALWIGFHGGGLGRLKDGRFARIQPEQGLFDDRISEMVADEHGWFWFGSGRGIFKIRGRDLNAVMEGQAREVRSIH